MKIKAMILAAGYGTRLLPLTRKRPKPLFPVLGAPILQHAVERLKRHAVQDLVINLHHLPEMISRHFGDGSRFGVRILYSRESSILGTAGGIKSAQEIIGDDAPFFVINSDIYWDLDLSQALDFHRRKKSCLTLVVKPSSPGEPRDPIEIGPDQRVTRFGQPAGAQASALTFTGIQIIEPEIFRRIPAGKPCETTRDIYPSMVAEGLPVHAYLHEGYWKDMGNPANYLQLHRDLLSGKTASGEPRAKPGKSGGNIIAPSWIAEDAVLAPSATVGPYAVLGEGCKVGPGATVQNSVCWEYVVIGENAQVRDSVLGEAVRVGEGLSVSNAVLSGD